MKTVFNRKGSTLLMALIMTAVLTILGTALISMTFMNINMKYNNDRAKKAMYYSESGIDQVYAYVGYTIEETLEDAREDTDDFREELLLYLETTIIRIDEATPAPYPGEIHEDAAFLTPLGGMSSSQFLVALGLKEGATYKKLYVKNGVNELGEDNYADKILDTELLMEVLDNYYKLVFMDLYDTTYANIDSTITGLTGIAYNGNDCNISVNGGIENFITSANDTFTIKGVHSEFNYNGKVNKAVTTNIVVKAPEELYPFVMVEDILVVENNPIWQNALVANDDILFTGDTGKEVDIYGDIYALGSKTTTTVTKEGIALENGAEVTVYGDLITKKNIQTTDANDLLNVKYGLLYCESLITQAGADNSAITISNGNVYTKDDIELNAVRSDIEITNGSYYGYSDGSELSSSHDNSSAVIVNVPLYKEGDPEDSNKPGTLIIDGLDPILDPKVANPSGTLELYQPKQEFSYPGVWIFGTSYANFDGEPADDGVTQLWPYQTGESVSIKGNYIAYSLPLYSPSNSDYADSNINYKYASIAPYNPAMSIAIATGTKSPDEVFNSRQKMEYFLEAYSLYPELFDIGDNIGPTNDSLNIENYKYVIGTKIQNNGTIDADYNYVVEFNELKQHIRHDFFYYLNNTTYYLNIDPLTGNNDYPSDSDPDYATEPADNYDVLAAHIDYYASGVLDAEDSMGDNRVVDYVNQTPLGNEKATEIIYVEHLASPTASDIKNYRLVGVGAGTAPSGYTNIVSESGADAGYFQGFIITQGDVLIDGDVNFTGTIIAGGTITVREGSGKSEFHNNEPETVEYMAEIIRNTPELRSLLKKGEKGDPIRFIRQDMVQGSDEGGSDISNVKNTYKRLIDFEFWRLN